MGEADRTRRSEEQPTCGQGLAAHSSVPEKIAEFLQALADNLDAHVPTIDTGDSNGRNERDAYEHLVSEYTAIARRLGATANRMRGYRDLPPARHHEEALDKPKLLGMFERFVTLEAELAHLLGESAERDGQFLQQARSEEA